MDGFARWLEDRDASPGTAGHHVSVDIQVLDRVIRDSTGQTIAILMGQKIIAPLGREAARHCVTDAPGVV